MMADMDKLEGVEAWLRDRNPAAGEIDLDTDLIDSRIIDSLAFTEFLLFLEDVVGHEITLDAKSVVALRTLRGIRDRVMRSA
jgi:acyl carrier protein